ncbi:nucleoporin protein Ndc1-Nup [Entophlyctis helioformis]|nr:nucleoporin protein Ndc1-Nup [Entophlyctis helioformis]
MSFVAAVRPVVQQALSACLVHTSLAALLASLLFYVPPASASWGLLSLLSRFVSLRVWLNTLVAASVLAGLVYWRSLSFKASASVYPNNLLWLYNTANIRLLASVAVHCIASVVLLRTFANLHNLGHAFYMYPKGQFSPPTIDPKSTFMLLFQLLVGPVYAIYRNWVQADQLHFPMLQRSVNLRSKSVFARSFSRGIRFGAIATVLYCVFFACFGWLAHYGVYSIFAAFKAKLLPYPNVFASTLLDIRLLAQLFSSAMFAMILFDLHATSVILPKPKLSQIIASLGENLDDYHRHIALMNLHWIVRYSPELRREIFNDVESSRPAWKSLLSTLSGSIDSLTTLLQQASEDGRVVGAMWLLHPSRVAAVPIAEPQLDKRASQLPSSPTPRGSRMSNISPTKTGPIYPPLQSKRSPLRDLLLDSTGPASDASRSPLVQAADASGLRRRGTAATSPGGVGAGSVATDGKAAELQATPVPGSREFLTALARQMERWSLGAYFLDETVLRRASCLMKDLQLHLWTIDALTGLAVAASSEDKYGIVHRDVPAVLHTLVRSLLGLEHFLSASHRDSMNRPLPVLSAWHRQSSKSAAWVVPEDMGVCIAALQGSIYRVTTTYYGHLTRFSFADDVAARLQPFLDFHE